MSYSYAKFSEEAGLTSKNYLQLIINGKRNLTISGIFKFNRVLKLRGNKFLYFEALVLFEQAVLVDERKFYLDKVKKIRKGKSLSEDRLTSRKMPELLHDIELSALLSSLMVKPPGVTLESLCEVTGLSIQKLKEYIVLLEKKKFIIKDRQRYRVDQSLLKFNFGKNYNYKEYQNEQLDGSRRALMQKSIDEAKFFSLIFTVDKGTLESLSESFQESLASLIDNNPDPKNMELLCLNAQLFPYKNS